MNQLTRHVHRSMRRARSPKSNFSSRDTKSALDSVTTRTSLDPSPRSIDVRNSLLAVHRGRSAGSTCDRDGHRITCSSVRSTIFASVVLSVATLVACGGSQPPPAPPTTDTSSDAGLAPAAANDAGATSAAPTDKHAESAEESAFDKLPKDKKAEVMMTKVVPNVGKLFKEHDGKKFEKFGCASCHGPQKKDDPHKVLPKLTLSNGGFEKLSKSKPEVMKLMAEKVVPAMADALGEKPFDPATKKGFGCAGCHTVD